VASIVDSHGRLDFAHNNAGISSVGYSVDTLPEEVWHRVVAVNLTGVWLSMKAELTVMRAQRSGSIVNTASICGLRAAAMTTPYNTTKHAVLGLTKEAAVEFAGLGVRINAVCPGSTHTAMSEKTTTPAEREMMAATVPMGRWAEPEEVAAAAAWLLSGDASYVTGASLVVDGGISERLPGPRD
jgi:NAD(P)-dependent dehydrogenase (short-subunit alcohol dehydrogenase family)